MASQTTKVSPGFVLAELMYTCKDRPNLLHDVGRIGPIESARRSNRNVDIKIYEPTTGFASGLCPV